MRKLITLVLSTLIVQPAFAAKVLTVKGQRVLLDSEGESFGTGDRLGIRNTDGKAIGLVVVEKVKGNRVVGRIQRGRAVVGASAAQLGESSGKSSASRSNRKSPSLSGRISSTSSYGILGGMTMTTQDLKTTSLSNSNVNVNVKAEGTSFNLLGFYQTSLSESFGLRLAAGMETIDIKGSVNNENFVANIKYLGINSIMKYNFYATPNFEVWAGGGLSFLINMSESQNVYKSSPKMMNSILFSLGTDIRIGNKSYLPLQFDYGYFQGTDTVETSQMMFRAGWAWNF